MFHLKLVAIICAADRPLTSIFSLIDA